MLGTYRRYVSLRTDMEQMGDDLFNSGTAGWRKNEFHKALGRTTEADSPLIFSLMQAHDAITGANKNEARQKLLDIVAANPEMGHIRRMYKLTKKWSYAHGEEAWVKDDSYNECDRDDVVMVRRDGNLCAIELNGKRGKRIAAAITNKNLSQWANDTAIGKITSGVTRKMSEMRTQYVPTFIARSIKAEQLDAFFNLIGDMGVGGAAKFMKSVEKHFVSNHKALQQYFTKGKVDTSTKEGQYFDEFTRNGGLIGGGARKGYAETANTLNGIIADLQRGKTNPKRWAKRVAGGVELLNEHAETGTRAAIYAALRDRGILPVALRHIELLLNGQEARSTHGCSARFSADAQIKISIDNFAF